MRKSVFSLLVLTALSFGVLAQDKPVTLTGHLIDKACSARMATKEKPQEAAGTHTKECSLKEGCAKSGFGVFADGKFTELDEKGAAMAKAALEKSSKASGANFKVTGKIADGKMTVQSISEVQ